MDIPNRRVASEPVLIKLLTNTKVLHVDVRPPEEFLAGRLPHSINIPIHELAKRLEELAKRKEVIAYCRGPYCLMSYDAVTLMREKGMKARRMEAGFPEWRAAGFPVVQ